MLAIHAKKVLKFLRESFSGSPSYVDRVIIFGSVARGDFKPYSDIDIAMVYEGDVSDVKKFAEEIANEVYLKFSIPIAIIYITKEDFDADRTSLIRTIKKEGVTIWRKD